MSLKELALLYEELENRRRYERFRYLFPYTGPLSRDKYPKHMEFFKATSLSREPWMLAGNRVGKTEAGCYTLTCVALGQYPSWWPGVRVEKKDIFLCAAGTTGLKTRDTLQLKLLGLPSNIGSGMLPKKSIIKFTPKSGIAEAKDSVAVRNAFGGISTIVFKSFDQGRHAFEGTEQDFILLDEEPPVDVYQECIMRTMTTKGIVMCTFTALQGITELITSTFPDGLIREGPVGTKYVVNATWDDAPHLSEEDKKQMVAALPAHVALNRKTGIPMIGEGLIYPVPEHDYVIEPIKFPDSFLHVYGFDVGWKKTAAVFAAIDPITKTKYIYAVHYLGEQGPSVHASAIKKYGEMPGVVDYAAHQRSPNDGRRLFDEYKKEGLELYNANKAVDAGIIKCYQALVLGKTKVFNTCVPFLHEIRKYRRDEKGKVVKVDDHLMDAWRYLEMSGEEHARACFDKHSDNDREDYYFIFGGRRGSWMGT
jgi:phage terminase large subunit-like protein